MKASGQDDRHCNLISGHLDPIVQWMPKAGHEAQFLIRVDDFITGLMKADLVRPSWVWAVETAVQQSIRVLHARG